MEKVYLDTYDNYIKALNSCPEFQEKVIQDAKECLTDLTACVQADMQKAIPSLTIHTSRTGFYLTVDDSVESFYRNFFEEVKQFNINEDAVEVLETRINDFLARLDNIDPKELEPSSDTLSDRLPLLYLSYDAIELRDDVLVELRDFIERFTNAEAIDSYIFDIPDYDDSPIYKDYYFNKEVGPTVIRKCVD